MKEITYNTIEELMNKAYGAIGQKIGDLDSTGRILNKKNKGNLGQILEEGFFGCKVNNRQEPDFPNLGVELKVTPYKWVNNNKKVSAKERLVLTDINYEKDYNVPFDESHCYKKMEKILMMFYEHETDKYSYDYIISKIILHEFSSLSSEDKAMILNDYKTILCKINQGEAHLISEGDTFYLGACTKGANSSSVANQPFSNVKAKKRAFCFKTAYMTQLLRKKVFNKENDRETFIKNFSILKTKSFKDIIEDTFLPYTDFSLDKIDCMIDRKINRYSKSYLRLYVSAMMNISSNDADELDEFVKANIKVKTIRINKKGKINEDMSFPCFKAMELIDETWEDSTLRTQYLNEKYLFCVFQEIDDSKKQYQFKKALLWSMPVSDLENDVYQTWKKTQETIISGIDFELKKQKNGKTIVRNNLPKKTENFVIHPRPHTQKSIYKLSDGIVIGNGKLQWDGDLLPDGRIMAKQCFFLNKEYILKIINK